MSQKIRNYPVDPVLTGYANMPIPRVPLIANKVMDWARVKGDAYKGQIEVESRRSFMGQDAYKNLERAGLAPYQELSDSAPSFVSYECKERSGKLTKSGQELRRLQDHSGATTPASRLERNRRKRALKAARTLRIKREYDCASLIFTAANYGSNTVALTAVTGGSGNKFGTSSAEEITDLLRAIEMFLPISGGARPTHAVIGIDAFNKLRYAKDWRNYGSTLSDRLAMNQDQIRQLLINTLELKDMYVGEARRESAQEGATSSEAVIWTDNIAFYFKGDAPPDIGTESEIDAGFRSWLGVYEDLDIPGMNSAGDISGGGDEVSSLSAHVVTGDDPPHDKVMVAESRDMVFTPPDGTGTDPLALLVTDLV